MRYQLRIRCELQQVDDHNMIYGQGISLEETAQMGPVGFMEIAAVLGQFHELIVKIKQQEESKT